jgi:hypothetical protein
VKTDDSQKIHDGKREERGELILRLSALMNQSNEFLNERELPIK